MQHGEGLTGKRVLVTGAGGFVGRHVVSSLAQAGAYVIAITGQPDCGLPFPAGATQAVEVDICDAKGIRLLATDCEIVVHLAGPPSVAKSFEDPAAFVRSHVEGTATLLAATSQLNTRRIVYVSSAEVYGQPASEFVAEEHRVQARSPYAACKIAAEQLLSAYSRSFCGDVVILRPFSLYGPGGSQDSLISRIVRLAQEGRAVALHDLRPVRDYCHVLDFARAAVSACLVPVAAATRVVNIGTMRGTSVAEIARLTLTALNVELPVTETMSEERRCGHEIYRLVADNSRARSTLGWSPSVTIEDGLRQLASARTQCASS